MKQKMKIKRILSLFLSLALISGFAGCMNREENTEEENPPEAVENDELVIYHNSTSVAPMLISLAEEYSAATGKKVSAKLSGSDFFGEMKSKSAAIYVVDTHSDLSDWHSGGLFTDFINDTDLSALTSKIPTGIQLHSAGIGSYGIPLVLEGYGYILDRGMFDDLFGAQNTENIINDLRSCSFTEFESFVTAVETYISSPSEAKIRIGENEYNFLPEKTGKANNLTGVFSLSTEGTRATEHLLSTALGSRFRSRYDVMNADENSVSGTKSVLNAFMTVLDFQTSHIAGLEGTIGRGDEFTGGDYNYSTAIDLFTRGNALFYPGGTSDAEDFEKSSPGFSENLDIIPMKLPLSDEDITASGMSTEKLRSSIIIGSRYYLALNPAADENKSAAARDFINWIYNDEKGKTAYSDAFGTVPFNFEYLETDISKAPVPEQSSGAQPEENSSGAESKNSSKPLNESSSAKENSPEHQPENDAVLTPSHRISTSLMAAVADYYAAGNWIPDFSLALPSGFADRILRKGLSDYWGKESWTDSDRSGFVEKLLSGWKENIVGDENAVG